VSIYTDACTCRDGECLKDRCRFCGAFDDPCPQTGATLPPGRWVGAVDPHGQMEQM
jgi:hypothetical protein